jgi:hypothetical protein
MSQDQESEYYYRYSQCQKINDYKHSDKMLEPFNRKSVMIKERIQVRGKQGLVPANYQSKSRSFYS